MISVAFQGEPGAYGEQALQQLFGRRARAVPVRDFSRVGRLVMDRSVDAGLLPIENSLAGTVAPSLAVLAEEELCVAGEVITPIHHNLLGLPGATIDKIVRALSHPVALAQCRRFFERTGIEAEYSYDTAGAAREVKAAAEPTTAAIAGVAAAERYGLEILAADIEDRGDNQTRFVAVVRAGSEPPPMDGISGELGPCRTALMADIANEPGALVELLAGFGERGINMSKLESRPGPEPWTYRFYIEVDMDAGASGGEEALAAASASAVNLRLLGTFRAHQPPNAPGVPAPPAAW